MNFIDTEEFIREIENRPSLWDITHEDYSCRDQKKACWAEMVDIFKDTDDIDESEKELFVDFLRKKWKAIRGCYTRELNRKKSTDRAQPRKSEYTYFKLLKFLQPVVNIKQSEPPIEISEGSEDDIEPNAKKLKRNQPCSNGTKDDNDSESRSNDSRDKHDLANEDEDKLFLMSLLSTLKQVPIDKKMGTKIKMMALLDEATRDVSQNTEQSNLACADVKVECDLLEISPSTFT